MTRTRSGFARVAMGTLTLLGTVGACGDDESTGSGNATGGAAGSTESPSGPELSELPPLLAEAMCGIYERCFGPLFDLFLLEDCTELTERRVAQGGFTRIESAVEAGRVQYDPSRAEECLSAYDNRECGDLLERHIDVCEEALGGTLEAGAECELDEECVGDSICLALDACPGECAPRQTAGEACQSDDQCADGLVCSKVTDLCVEPAAAGDACEGGVEAQCTPGLVCLGADEDEERTGTCRSLDELLTAAEGEDCDIGRGPLCQSGLDCAVTALSGAVTGSLPGTCEQAVGSGEGCTVAVPSQCPQDEYCAIEAADLLLGQLGVCTPLPQAGEPCAPDLGSHRCEAFARCVDDTCIAMRNLGESCTVDDVCYSEHCVDGGCAPDSGC